MPDQLDDVIDAAIALMPEADHCFSARWIEREYPELYAEYEKEALLDCSCDGPCDGHEVYCWVALDQEIARRQEEIARGNYEARKSYVRENVFDNGRSRGGEGSSGDAASGERI